VGIIIKGVGENPLYTFIQIQISRDKGVEDRDHKVMPITKGRTECKSSPRRQEVMRSQPSAKQRRTVDDGDGVYDDYNYEDPSSKQRLNDVE